MAILEFILALVEILVVVTCLPIGVWHVTYSLRRKHRLERQSDDRENAKLRAEEFTRITKELTEGQLNFEDYIAGSWQQKEKAKQLAK